MHIYGVFIVCIVLSPTLALAQDDATKSDLSLGGGVRVSTSEYRGEDAHLSPIPLLEYEGEYVYLDGLSAGAYLYRDESNKISIDIEYLSMGFDASENDDSAMRQLEDRDASVLAGATYRFKSDWGVSKVSLATDVSGTSDGLIARVSQSYPFMYSFLKISPMVGLEWTSENYNEYYYGVSREESLRSGLDSYKAEGGISPSIGVSFMVDISENISAKMRVSSKLLSQEISNSPMVDTDVVHSFIAGISYSF
jgi:outer membrane protein